MKNLNNHFKRYGIYLTIFFTLGAFATPASAFTVKKSEGGTTVAEESLVPHDYIIIKPDILPCVHHAILGNLERLHFTKEQEQALNELLRSPEIKAMAARAKEIKVLEEQAKKRFYTGTATREEMAPQFKKIAALRVEHTLRFMEIQNTIFKMLSREQHEELMKIMAEQGI